MKDKLTALVVEGRITRNDFRTIENAFATVAEQAARIAELEACLRERDDHLDLLQKELDTWVDSKEVDVSVRRIAELEKQAAIDKTMLALADARINRELRDDFAGRAMQGALSSGSFSMLGNRDRAKFAYTMADEMLKAKGGA